MSKGESKEYRTRLKEITSVLHKYGITRGNYASETPDDTGGSGAYLY